MSDFIFRLKLVAVHLNSFAVTLLVGKSLAAISSLGIWPVFRKVRLLRHVYCADILSHLLQSLTNDSLTLCEQLPITCVKIFWSRIIVMVLSASDWFLEICNSFQYSFNLLLCLCLLSLLEQTGELGVERLLWWGFTLAHRNLKYKVYSLESLPHGLGNGPNVKVLDVLSSTFHSPYQQLKLLVHLLGHVSDWSGLQPQNSRQVVINCVMGNCTYLRRYHNACLLGGRLCSGLLRFVRTRHAEWSWPIFSSNEPSERDVVVDFQRHWESSSCYVVVLLNSLALLFSSSGWYFLLACYVWCWLLPPWAARRMVVPLVSRCLRNCIYH